MSGSVEATLAVVESLDGRAHVGRLSVFAHDLGQPEIDGLLGRDFLEQFNVSIDSRRGAVTLTPR